MAAKDFLSDDEIKDIETAKRDTDAAWAKRNAESGRPADYNAVFLEDDKRSCRISALPLSLTPRTEGLPSHTGSSEGIHSVMLRETGHPN